MTGPLDETLGPWGCGPHTSSIIEIIIEALRQMLQEEPTEGEYHRLERPGRLASWLCNSMGPDEGKIALIVGSQLRPSCERELVAAAWMVPGVCRVTLRTKGRSSQKTVLHIVIDMERLRTSELDFIL